jgi:hypothetical protein
MFPVGILGIAKSPEVFDSVSPSRTSKGEKRFKAGGLPLLSSLSKLLSSV